MNAMEALGRCKVKFALQHNENDNHCRYNIISDFIDMRINIYALHLHISLSKYKIPNSGRNKKCIKSSTQNSTRKHKKIFLF